MELFLRYLKNNKKTILLWILFVFLFSSSFALYQLPVRAVMYPTVLCLMVGVAVFMLDYHKVTRQHKCLQEMISLSNNLYELMEQQALMNDSNSIKEQDLLEIISRMTQVHENYIYKSNLKLYEMTDYYTVWAHQIKTPIAAMRLQLQNEDSPLCRELLLELNRIESYVNMVLTFIRMESDTSDYVIMDVQLEPMVKQVIKQFSGEFIQRKLSLQLDSLVGTVLTDEKWFSFVVAQVLSNALKYTKQGAIHIYLKDEELVIQDSGIGIAKEDTYRVFEKGFTGFNGRVDKKASGLGLYLCKRICDQLGHSIRLDSVVDEGTTVYIGIKRKQLTVSD